VVTIKQVTAKENTISGAYRALVIIKNVFVVVVVVVGVPAYTNGLA